MALRQRSIERVASLCRDNVVSKIWAGAKYGATAYIYQRSSVADMELSSPQCLLLALFHSLVSEDTTYCCFLADVCHQVQQLQSDYLKVWLTGDFAFPRKDMGKALTFLGKLLEAGLLKLPSHVARIFCALETKYRMQRILPTLPVAPPVKGYGDIASHPKEAFPEDNSPRDIAAFAAVSFLDTDLEALNSNNETLLEEAITRDCVSSVKALIMAGAKIDRRLFREDTYLHIAAAGGHNEALEVLLESEIDVNLKNHLGETPLFQAVRASNVRGVELLVEKGADRGIFPEDDKSPIEMVVESNNIEMFKALVKAGTNLVSKDGDSIFHLVARFGNTEMLEVIQEKVLQASIKNQSDLTPLHHIPSNSSVFKIVIKMGLDVNERTGKGEIVLHLDASKRPLELVRKLWNERFAIDIQESEGTSALMIVVTNSREDPPNYLFPNSYPDLYPETNVERGPTYTGRCIGLLRNLLNAGARLEKQCTALLMASQEGNSAMVKMLVAAGAAVDMKDMDQKTALHLAAEKGHTAVMCGLLTAGGNVNMKNNYQKTALHLAAEKDYIAMIKKVVDMKDNYQNAALHLAAENGHIAAMDEMLDAGADVDIKNRYQNTALHIALEKSYSAMVMRLLRAGAALDMKNSDQNTPLHIAVEKPLVGVVMELLAVGVPLDVKNSSQSTPLHIAAEMGSVCLVKALLRAGAAVDMKNSDQNTALYFAAANGYITIIADLLAAGADPSARCSRGLTPLIAASRNGQATAVRELIDNSANININARSCDGRTALAWAIRNNHTAVAIYLRSKGGIQ